MSHDNTWVRTEPTIDGRGYMVTLSTSDDDAMTLDRDAAYAYAGYVLAIVARAEYDAGVFRQMRKLHSESTDEHAAQVIIDLRTRRPELASRWPLALEAGVNQKGKPFLIVSDPRTGEAWGQWTPAQARKHATHVLEAVEVADLDRDYLLVLTSDIGVSEESARAVVEALSRYR